MKSVSFLRHSGWFGPEDATTLNIIGVGATGSFIGLYAARMGFHKFRIWDGDIVEDHNLPNQIYNLDDIGTLKVDAFEKVLKTFNPSIQVEKYNTYFESENDKALLEDGPLVLTVDTMSARKNIFDSFNLNWQVDKVFETRLGFDYAEINIIDNLSTKSLDNWYKSLVNDSDVPDGPCNLRICTTLVSMVAAYTVHQICNMLSAERHKKQWEYKEKSMLNLKPTLETFYI